MNYYAHTAEDEHGKPLPKSSGRWQPLAGRLKIVVELTAEFSMVIRSQRDLTRFVRSSRDL